MDILKGGHDQLSQVLQSEVLNPWKKTQILKDETLVYSSLISQKVRIMRMLLEFCFDEKSKGK